MRSIADQPDRALGGRMSVLVRQRNDHIRLDELLERLDGTTGEAQEEVLARVNRLVFPHAYAEEVVLWPALRRLLPDGERLTLEVEQEHQEINELVVALEHGDRDDLRRPEQVRRLVELLRQDVRDEEDELLPRLRAVAGDEQLRRLGWQWELVRRAAPTRPHPAVSRRPPGNVAAALPLTLVDRSREVVDAAARHAPRPVSSGLRAVGGGLARAAHQAERLPLFRRGEDPGTRHDR